MTDDGPVPIREPIVVSVSVENLTGVLWREYGNRMIGPGETYCYPSGLVVSYPAEGLDVEVFDG